ncbi:MAG: hypothetical protein IJV05_10665 [Muribaculaceae bacterium]|nr:hypothetical protein [Muribaculaceae bacterium]
MSELHDILTSILDKEMSPDMMKVKLKILNRIADEADVKPSRINAPMNITEVGGYINLLRKLNKEAQGQADTAYTRMLEQTLISILGLPVQPPAG